jgi:hypothetical protein
VILLFVGLPAVFPSNGGSALDKSSRDLSLDDSTLDPTPSEVKTIVQKVESIRLNHLRTPRNTGRVVHRLDTVGGLACDP